MQWVSTQVSQDPSTVRAMAATSLWGTNLELPQGCDYCCWPWSPQDLKSQGQFPEEKASPRHWGHNSDRELGPSSQTDTLAGDHAGALGRWTGDVLRGP